MKEDMQKKLFCKIVLITFFVAECTFNISVYSDKFKGKRTGIKLDKIN